MSASAPTPTHPSTHSASDSAPVSAGRLHTFWMPFSASGDFCAKPRMVAGAEGMYCRDADGRKLIDSSAGLWCCNAGHCREPIARAIAEQAAELDFAPTFQFGHPKVYEFTERLAQWFPDGMNTVFLSNSGSEAVDSALKIALAYQRIRGKGEKVVLVGRERGYHGVGFGGISVGGIVKNRMWFGNRLPFVDHLPHTHGISDNLFSRGQPKHGADRADALLDIIALHDASSIAAVIVEPVAGSTGVLPPPIGYLERLREICDAHDILLIFDEVITAFGRLGTKTAAEFFGVTPDMTTFAKGSTSGTVPLGGVVARDEIRQAFLESVNQRAAIDLFHGYTYSGHPLACAAGIATLKLYDDEGLVEKANKLAPYFEKQVHSLRDCPNVVDIRNIGLMGAVELAPIPGKPGERAYEAMTRCFHDHEMMLRVAGEVIALSPPLIAERKHIDEIVGKLRAVLADLP